MNITNNTTSQFQPRQRVYDSFRGDFATVVEVTETSVVLRHDKSYFNAILTPSAAERDLKVTNVKV